MKKKRLIFIALFLSIIAALAVYNYVFNAKHRDIAKEEAAVAMSAAEISNLFKTDESTATTNYLDQVVQLTGRITSIEDGQIVLDDGAQISFINPIDVSKYSQGKTLEIKGRCVGYDELLELVKIDQSTLIKN
ncbi:MAG: hypothetical protein ED556_03615 [Winogradskyella sp.]|uniref:OB-fold protein n=1 Tax=Winogradskyella sp. TaxID=1883156 RepID=UPI000F40CD9E|nr:hypothetical protein [Winogradskyella sp.]RNC88282.1 MAG: hypothetical protein ED556_03615 [Winogradskyella sp.]